MKTFLISSNSEIQRIQFEDKDYGVYSRAIMADVESHNALNPNDIWKWGEEGSLSDPTLTDDQRKSLSDQIKIDRIAALSKNDQKTELEARLTSLASTADGMARQAEIRGIVFDAKVWFQQESSKITALYTKV